MFHKRSTELERIDTGDYTSDEYERFLREIAFINRFLGDKRALNKTLMRSIEAQDLREFSVLDVGCGSGELLKVIAVWARRFGRDAALFGIDLNPISAAVTHSASVEFPEISVIRGDAFELPFGNDTFDYAISSLFFHHLTDDQIPAVLTEMSRVSRRGVYVIDLHRHPAGYAGYKIFCYVFGISPLVREDGALSVLKGFRPQELRNRFEEAGLLVKQVKRISPFRIVVSSSAR